MQTSFAISGMTCDGCRSKVEKTLKALGTDAVVTREPPRAIVTSDQPVPLPTVQAALAAVGKYTAELSDQAPPKPVTAAVEPERSWLATYYPLLLIAGYLAVVSLAGTGSSSAMAWMTNFMAGFFLVFSAFKFLDLRGFAEAYSTYDLLAMRVPAYGLVYPFLELGLGLAYLFGWAPMVTNVATLVLMGFGSLGVLKALSEQRTIRCACLGTVLNLPMSTVTLAEDLLMAGMAGLMLVG